MDTLPPVVASLPRRQLTLLNLIKDFIMQRSIAAAVITLGLFSPSVHAAEAPVPATRFTVGGGIAIAPEYAGGDDYRAFPLIVLDYQHSSGLFASTARGLGYAGSAGSFSYSAAIGHNGGRTDRKRSGRSGSDDLKGMGEIRGSVTTTLAGGYRLDNGITFGAKAVMALSHRENGNHYEFGVQAPLLSNDKDEVSLIAIADYADKKQMRTFHGVTVEQSLRSGYAVYTPKAGFSKVGVGINWQRKLNDKWSVNSTVGVGYLVGDAADSPLTKKKTIPMLATALNYSF